MEREENTKMPAEKCIVCGKEAEVESLCNSCYLERNPIVKDFSEIKLSRCTYCGRFLFEGRWMNEETLIEAIPDKIKIDSKYKKPKFRIEFSFKEENNIKKAQGEISAKVMATPADSKGKANFSEDYSLPVEIINSCCDKCKLKSSKYYESVIQVRPSPNKGPDSEESFSKVYEGIKKQVSLLESKGLYITKTEPAGGGYDLYLTNNTLTIAIARKIAALFGAELKINERLFSQEKSGKYLYRVTAFLQAPDFISGSIIAIGEGSSAKVVEALQAGKTILARDMMTGKKCAFQRDSMPKITALQNYKAQIIRRIPFMEVLSPETFQGEKPINQENSRVMKKYAESCDDSAAVVMFEGKIYLV
jgi:NMD protein affecting ribosome stability and mRNA decay